MFDPCLHGFSLGSVASSYSRKKNKKTLRAPNRWANRYLAFTSFCGATFWLLAIGWNPNESRGDAQTAEERAVVRWPKAT